MVSKYKSMFKKTENQNKIKSKSIRDNYCRGELKKEILKGLILGGFIVASFALPNLPQILTLFDTKNSRERFKIKRVLKNLQNQKFIDIYEKDNEQIVKITEKGQQKILKYKFDELKITRPKKWDGCWRIIAFDIPEKRKKARNALTMKLKEMELYPLQKSVFICPFKCRDEIDFVGEIFNIKKFIHYFIAKEIDEKDTDYLRKYYNL